MDAASCLACEASGWVDVCSGDSECTSDLHVHGCFADVGNCAAPGEHAHHNPDMTPERYAAELDATYKSSAPALVFYEPVSWWNT